MPPKLVNKNNLDSNIFDTSNYTVIKKFQNGKHAQLVYLLEHTKTGHKLIKKRYKAEHSDIFANEVKYLKLLQGCNFTPGLFKSNSSNYTIYMEYCGNKISSSKFKQYDKQIKYYQKELKQKWNIYHNDLKLDNICIKNNKIYFIDFGWTSSKKILPGYGNTTAKHSVNERVKRNVIKLRSNGNIYNRKYRYKYR